ncbi:uncharacterized protein LOC8061277 isoform X2 [Sorghum bicolor]|uniref:uncharacterized protein LOC8061277 isoform X2 n=1 Tax=Sorghum bicolor TaxID=4558 RepID=UPI000B425174|nr:uncharacterized protein LOC8061277 isoform X2 [Sorghum bicolor]|eukprot:XP_021303070.1 uncharacterized protein LOC8061277 isoform X2 [Sorghum bicolor]
MACRRKPQPQPQPTPSFEHHYPPFVGPASPDSLAKQAMRASAAHRDASSLASAYSSSASLASSLRSHHEPSVSTQSPDCSGYEYTSMKSLNEAKYGFWGTLARKAKSFLDEDCSPEQYKSPRDDVQVDVQLPHSKQLSGETWKPETPPSQKRSESITSSLTHIGGTIKNALEEGRTIVENKTADIIQETRKLNIRRKGAGLNTQGEAGHKILQRHLPQNPLDHETQLKASRDVANAMAAKAKLLLRELKTLKADLAFAKERCAQLEEENKMLRESYDKGDNPEDDDLDLHTRNVLLRSNSSGPLYTLQLPSSSFGPCALVATPSPAIWHRRLGHPGKAASRALLSPPPFATSLLTTPYAMLASLDVTFDCLFLVLCQEQPKILI